MSSVWWAALGSCAGGAPRDTPEERPCGSSSHIPVLRRSRGAPPAHEPRAAVGVVERRPRRVSGGTLGARTQSRARRALSDLLVRSFGGIGEEASKRRAHA